MPMINRRSNFRAPSTKSSSTSLNPAIDWRPALITHERIVLKVGYFVIEKQARPGLEIDPAAAASAKVHGVGSRWQRDGLPSWYGCRHWSKR